MWLTDRLQKISGSLPAIVIDLSVMMQVYFLAVLYWLKETWFTAQQGFNKKAFEVELEKSHFNQREHKVALVTGGNGTIGREMVNRLLSLGWEVHSIAHVSEEAREVFGNMGLMANPKLKLHEVDFVDLEQTSLFANQLMERLNRLDLIICTAGVLLSDKKVSGKTGEEHMNINVVSHALLVKILLEKLALDGRVQFLSSCTARACYFSESFLNSRELLRHYDGPYQAYGLSKLLLAVYGAELSKSMSASHPDSRVCSVHPGVVPSKLYRHTNILVRFVTYYICPYLMRTADWAALFCLHTVFRDDVVTGAYYEDTRIERLREDVTKENRRTIYSIIQRDVSKHDFPALGSGGFGELVK